MQNSIKTPREFFDRVVTPDWEELKKNPHDVRIAFHASISLHQLRDWVFKAYLKGHLNFPQYCEDLCHRCSDLKVIGDLASNAKHFPPNPKRAEKMEVGVSAAPTNWGDPTAIWGVAHWEKTERNQVIAQKDDGSKQWMIPIIWNAYSFWEKEFLNNGW